VIAGPGPAELQATYRRIAPRYDLLTTLSSLGWDRRWRRRAADLAAIAPGETVLDMCCGTGKLAEQLRSRAGRGLVIGIDFSAEMLQQARRRRRGIVLLRADAASPALREGSVDVITVGFAIRHLPERERALRSWRRLLRPGGRLVILEFLPAPPGLRGALLRGVAGGVVPALAKAVNRRNRGEYDRLARNPRPFPSAGDVAREVTAAGFEYMRCVPMTLGVVGAHLARSPGGPTSAALTGPGGP
jgi:demethylmenaquinone methyltransferase/2-methoxy-6-polyprenyl-1,4-benzoquinol methylase